MQSVFPMFLHRSTTMSYTDESHKKAAHLQVVEVVTVRENLGVAANA